jgi:1-acyl-sn-glycerol-3-phosphate acyltransferase
MRAFPALLQTGLDKQNRMLPASSVASIIASALVVALVLWIVVACRRSHYTYMHTFFARVLWRTQTTGKLAMPEGQGAVIVCNHRSGIDPLLIQLCAGRIVHWMVAREYYRGFGISIVFKSLRSIPVNRGGIDTAATKMAIRLAQQGGLVGLFPEGRVNLSDELLLPGRPGAALIALRARVPVIPCYVEGPPYNGTALGSFFMAARARVIVGEPIDISAYYGRERDKSVMQELTKKFLVEIAKLAGEPNFEPKIAGRNWKLGEDDGAVNGALQADVSALPAAGA